MEAKALAFLLALAPSIELLARFFKVYAGDSHVGFMLRIGILDQVA